MDSPCPLCDNIRLRRYLELIQGVRKEFCKGMAADALKGHSIAYLCVQHGGSPACEAFNKRNKRVCPKCEECPSISPNGRKCILAAPHTGCEHESAGYGRGRRLFEAWTDEDSKKRKKK